LFPLDGGEFDKWVDLFIDDGTFDAGRMGAHRGKDALRAFLKNIRLTNGLPMMKHCVMNEVIKVNSNEATAKSSIVVVRAIFQFPLHRDVV
jgi:hypothetical protein